MTKPTAKMQGMTLLEVMVALVIFSTAALALMNSVSLNVRFTHGLADTLQASWVAENQIAQAKLENSAFPEAPQRGSETMGGRTWLWRVQRIDTGKRRFADEVQVFAEGEESQPVLALRIPDPEEAP